MHHSGLILSIYNIQHDRDAIFSDLLYIFDYKFQLLFNSFLWMLARKESRYIHLKKN